MNTVQYTEIDYRELEDLVIQYFPKAEFNFVADEEADNDSSYSFYSNKEAYLKWSNRDRGDFFSVISGNSSSMSTRLLLDFLVYAEEIPEGNILIKVNW